MIYYVEDYVDIRAPVIYTLEKSGLPAQGFTDGTAFWQAMQAKRPDLVLLDIMLPGEDGLTILQRLRRDPDTAQLPIIMLTAKGAEYDKVIGLDSGADDYVSKPFGMMELVSRVRALLRRTVPQPGEGVLSCGPVTVDDGRHQVTVNGQPITLTLKEYDLLHFLLRNRGMVFSRERLLRDVWGYDYEGGTRTVDVHVQTLRQKLGEGASIVETVRGVGYRAGEGQA